MSRWSSSLYRLPDAAALSLILMIVLSPLNETSARRSSIMPTDMGLKLMVRTCSTSSIFDLSHLALNDDVKDGISDARRVYGPLVTHLQGKPPIL